MFILPVFKMVCSLAFVKYAVQCILLWVCG